MDVIKFNPKILDHERHIKNGKQICSENIFFKNMVNLVQYPEFIYMLKNYFDSWENIQTFIMFIKVYESITKKYPDITEYEKISILKLLIDNSETRKIICKEIINHTQKKQAYTKLLKL